MKKFLPIFFIFIFSIQFLFFAGTVFAQTPTQPPTTVGQLTPIPDGSWVQDSDVTFAGKLAARSAQMLDWILGNVGWANSSGPIAEFWVTIRNIVYAFLALMVLITAFVLVITRGKSIGARKFIPRFFFAVIFVTLSFSIVQFLYIIADIIQGQFLTINNVKISSADLLNVAFNYNEFTGLKRTGIAFEESAFISTLLVKLTAITFYVMSGLLIVRKIILWFFIAISPVLPLLLFYYPVRNTAKIWIGEFFRWLLYAPLFAIFLYSVVIMWKNESFAKGANNILFFNETQVNNDGTSCDQLTDPENPNYKGDGLTIRDKTCYPIAINILLGGPGQLVVYEEDGMQNSVTRTDTFALYVVALIMLWIVIILPFVLLQIFLEYFYSFASNENSLVMQLMNRGSNIFNKNPPPGPSPTPQSPKGAGMARALPFITPKKLEPAGQADTIQKGAGMAREMFVQQQQTNLRSLSQSSPLLRLTQLSVPTIRDIARYETSSISSNIKEHSEVIRVRETLEKISNPTIVQTPAERNQFSSMRQTLVSEKSRGNPVATAILSAANTISKTTTTNNVSSSQTTIKETTKTQEVMRQIANPSTVTNVTKRESISNLKETLTTESQKGNQLATTVLNAITKLGNEENTQIHNTLTKIANTENISNPSEKQTFSTIKEQLTTESQKGNQLAKDLLTVVSNESQMSSKDTSYVTTIKEKLLQAKEQGDPVASKILEIATSTQTVSEVTTVKQLKEQLKEAKEKRKDSLAAAVLTALGNEEEAGAPGGAPSQFPVANRVQQVSLDDYEAVKKLWQENYQKLEPPHVNGRPIERKEWVSHDLQVITDTINLLLSSDQEKTKEGMGKVSNILPFLLIGGFSQTEVVAYLKAKLEAAKATLDTIEKQEQEEDSQVSVERKQVEKPKEMVLEQKVPDDEDKKPQS